MANIYYRLVKSGAYTLERVPAKWRDEVKVLLEAEEESTSEVEE